MNTPVGSYVRRSVFSCAVPLLFIPGLFVLLAGAAGQFPFTLQAVVNSLLLVYWIGFVGVLGAWAVVVLPTMLWVPPQSSLWRAGPATASGAALGLLAMFLIVGVPQFPGASPVDTFFLVAPFVTSGAAVGFLAHRSMTLRA